jgi:TolB-like protein/DNA-binding response OmpR family regulator
MRSRIMIIGRDAALRAQLAQLAKRGGYRAEVAESLARAHRAGLDEIGLAIVDPEGLDASQAAAIEELRAVVGRVLVVTPPGAKRSSNPDAVDPSDEAGLLSRIAGALAPQPAANESELILKFAGYRLDLAGHSLTDPAGKHIPLTHGEFGLLRALVERAGRVLSRDQLLQLTAGRDAEAYDRSVDMHIARLRRKIEPDPKRPSLIVTVPGAGYKFIAAVREAKPAAGPAPKPPPMTSNPFQSGGLSPLPMPDRPSIAVLPFQNMSGDPEQDYFADGMVEDIITGLSRIKWLFVIARNSSAVYKGRAVDVRQAGHELGVRYLLEGGVRRSGRRLRISAQLVEAETGAHLWADKFDGELEDVFDLQDRITEQVVGIVEPSVQRSEIERSRRKRPESLDAHDLYLRALPYVRSIDPESAPIATSFLREAVEAYPSFALAHAYLAWSHQIRFTHAGFDGAEKTAAMRHARAATASDVDDAAALAVGAMVIGLLGKDATSALDAIERALSFNPSSAAAHFFGGELYAWSGHPVRGTELARRALRLSPFDPLSYIAHLAFGIATFHQGSYEEAASWWEKCWRANPRFGGFLFGRAASLALVGRIEEAKPVCTKVLELEPSYSIRTIHELGYAPEIEALWLRAARLLGVPD